VTLTFTLIKISQLHRSIPVDGRCSLLSTLQVDGIVSSAYLVHISELTFVSRNSLLRVNAGYVKSAADPLVRPLIRSNAVLGALNIALVVQVSVSNISASTTSVHS
jgi:hypothetical protein